MKKVIYVGMYWNMFVCIYRHMEQDDILCCQKSIGQSTNENDLLVEITGSKGHLQKETILSDGKKRRVFKICHNQRTKAEGECYTQVTMCLHMSNSQCKTYRHYNVDLENKKKMATKALK